MPEYYVKIGKRYIKCSPYQGTDIEVCIAGAVRYAMGRASYSPRCAMDFCRANWQEFTPKTRKVIMRDVLKWLGERKFFKDLYKTGSLAEGDYPDEWRKFLRWCFAQDKADAAWAAGACRLNMAKMQDVDEFFGYPISVIETGS